MGSSGAPKYATTKYTTGGLFGSATSGEKGTKFKANTDMKTAGESAWGGLNQTLSSLGSNDYVNDPNFKVYENNINRLANNAFQGNVLSALANQGLMRSSGLQSAANAFNETLANNMANLYDSYHNRLSTDLGNYRGTLNDLYSYITGINNAAMGNAQNVSNYNMQKYQANQAAQGNMFGALANAAGQIYGSSVDALSNAAPALLAASDIDVKKNIKKIGKKNGYNWYEFEYKEGLGLPKGKQEGVIAQEVEKINPGAVVEINGIKHVDYNKL